MSIQGDIATEGTVKEMVTWVKKQLVESTDSTERRTLARCGLHALTLFDWSTPQWADEFRQAFMEVLDRG